MAMNPNFRPLSGNNFKKLNVAGQWKQVSAGFYFSIVAQ